MANGGMAKKGFGESHDVLRFGVNDSVRGDLAPPHPLQATIQSVTAALLLPLRSPPVRFFVKP
jgi:proteasome maturation protein